MYTIFKCFVDWSLVQYTLKFMKNTQTDMIICYIIFIDKHKRFKMYIKR